CRATTPTICSPTTSGTSSSKFRHSCAVSRTSCHSHESGNPANEKGGRSIGQAEGRRPCDQQKGRPFHFMPAAALKSTAKNLRLAGSVPAGRVAIGVFFRVGDIDLHRTP